MAEIEKTEKEKKNGAANPKADPQFHIQRVFTKDISFETPNSPAIFQKDWKPEVKLDLDTRSNKLGDNAYEVVIVVTVTAKVENDTAFLCEVHQAGIFTIANIPKQQLAHALGAGCPNILFPYARETVASLVNRGTFPSLNLAPVNFDALFAQYLQQRQQEAAEGEGANT